jgi:ADP-heptose:LPS heptosyltransferase
MPFPGPLNNILLVCIGGIGDIVMMTPVIKALQERLPMARLSVLTIPRSREAARNVMGKWAVYTIPMVYKQPTLFSLVRIIPMVFHLRKQRFDLLINLRATETEAGKWKMLLLTKLVNARTSIGRNINGKGDFYTFAIDEKVEESRTEVELTARLLEPLGITGIDMGIAYEVRSSDRDFIGRYLGECGVKTGTKLIGMNPGAFRPSRRWTISHWKSLIGLISRDIPECRIVVTGEAGEIPFISGMCVAGNVLCTNGRLTIGQLAALCERMDVFITNDTGPMHLAAAAGTKVVALFGPGDVARFKPSVPEARYRIVRTEEVACKRPCYQFRCNDPICLTSISAEQVLNAIREVSGGAL